MLDGVCDTQIDPIAPCELASWVTSATARSNSQNQLACNIISVTLLVCVYEHFMRDTGWHAVLMFDKYPVPKAEVKKLAEELIIIVVITQHKRVITAGVARQCG